MTTGEQGTGLSLGQEGRPVAACGISERALKFDLNGLIEGMVVWIEVEGNEIASGAAVSNICRKQGYVIFKLARILKEWSESKVFVVL